MDIDLTKTKEFAILREHLIEPSTLKDIEYREIVHDPINAEQTKLSGHFYPAWEKFRDQLKKANELWSFKAFWKNYEWDHELKRGCAVVTNEQIGQEFVNKISDAWPNSKVV